MDCACCKPDWTYSGNTHMKSSRRYLYANALALYFHFPAVTTRWEIKPRVRPRTPNDTRTNERARSLASFGRASRTALRNLLSRHQRRHGTVNSCPPNTKTLGAQDSHTSGPRGGMPSTTTTRQEVLQSSTGANAEDETNFITLRASRLVY